MTDEIKSPFWIDQNFLSSDEVVDLASKLWVEPTRDEHGQEFPIQRNVPEVEKYIYDKTTNTMVEFVYKKNKWNVVPSGSLVTAKIGEALRKNHRKSIVLVYFLYF